MKVSYLAKLTSTFHIRSEGCIKIMQVIRERFRDPDKNFATVRVLHFTKNSRLKKPTNVGLKDKELAGALDSGWGDNETLVLNDQF